MVQRDPPLSHRHFLEMGMGKNIIIDLIFFILLLAVLMLVAGSFAHADRDSCECRELRRIRQLLEQQSGLICNEFRCQPAPTPTAPNGGELP